MYHCMIEGPVKSHETGWPSKSSWGLVWALLAQPRKKAYSLRWRACVYTAKQSAHVRSVSRRLPSRGRCQELNWKFRGLVVVSPSSLDFRQFRVGNFRVASLLGKTLSLPNTTPRLKPNSSVGLAGLEFLQGQIAMNILKCGAFMSRGSATGLCPAA